MELQHSEVTDKILGAAFEVHQELGYGFLERVYQRAMQFELELRGVTCELEAGIEVRYKNEVVGEYRADLLVSRCVLVEIKVATTLDTRDEAQLLNQLKATGIKVGLLINFGKNKVEFKRLIF
ncbi:MAG: GxxExxY protein [Planctomycetaceae bacterium]